MKITDHGLHIVPGDSAGGTWLYAFDAEDLLLVHRDDLSTGPFIETSDIATWHHFRDTYWRETLPQYDDFFSNPDELCFGLDAMRNLDRIEADVPIYIWVGTNLPDQFFLLFAVDLVTKKCGNANNVRIIQFEEGGQIRSTYFSIAVVPLEIVEQLPVPRALSPEQQADYRAAWKALTSPGTEHIMAFLDNHWKDHPYLAQALWRTLYRFPQERSGLPFFDDRLVMNVESEGPEAVSVIARTLCDIWEVGDSIGDVTLFQRLRRLGSDALPKPLVELKGNPLSYRDTQVKLTPFGKAVVEGRESSWPSNPIDDWIGGVRISAEHPPQWMVTTEGKLRRINDSDFEP